MNTVVLIVLGGNHILKSFLLFLGLYSIKIPIFICIKGFAAAILVLYVQSSLNLIFLNNSKILKSNFLSNSDEDFT